MSGRSRQGRQRKAGAAALSDLLSDDLAPLFHQAVRTDSTSAWFGHIPFAHWVVRQVRPDVIVELGTHAGVSYSAFCSAVLREGLATRCFAVDTWQGDDHAGHYSDTVYDDFSRFNAEHYGSFSTLLRKTFDEALDDIDDNSIDLLHIDGFHSYDAVQHDFETWAQKLSDRAVVLLHDTNERREGFGVWRYWAELREQYPAFEFLHSHGLGVLCVGGKASDTISALCGLDDTQANQIRDRFEAAGDRWVQRAGRSILKSTVKQLQSDNKRRETESAEQEAIADRLVKKATAAAAAAKRKAKKQIQSISEELEQACEANAAHELRVDDLQMKLNQARKEAEDAEQRLVSERTRAAEQAKEMQNSLNSVSGRMTAPLRAAASLADTRSGWAPGALIQRFVKPTGAHSQRQLQREIKALTTSELFDPDWYLATYPDVAATGMDPLQHYCEHGWREGCDPGPGFSTSDYLSINEDVNTANLNPLFHYERYGKREGRSEHPIVDDKFANSAPEQKFSNATAVTPSSDSEILTYHERRQNVLHSGFWDEVFYLDEYYDTYVNWAVKAGNSPSPLDHFMTEGWQLGFKPSNHFPITIAQSINIDPISHFLEVLRFEGYHFDANVWPPTDDKIQAYNDQKSHRNSTKVVYTCITGNYNDLIQPQFINSDWDYICFTDSESMIHKRQIGIWDIRPVINNGLPPSRTNRWHKIHPHLILPQYKESLYIDGNVTILTDFIFKEIVQKDSKLLFPKHFKRNCIYDEISTLLHSSRISSVEKSLLLKQRKLLQNDGFPPQYGLTENNMIYRRHLDEQVIRLMNLWWLNVSNFSSRDQASFSYVLWKQGLETSSITTANCRVNYKHFGLIKHNENHNAPNKINVSKKLTPAFSDKNIAVILSSNENFVHYLAVALESIIQNSSHKFNYDIIILNNDLSSKSESRISSLGLNNKTNISIRFYKMNDILSQVKKSLHISGYVPIETYNKCFLDIILDGYERCIYLDTDIVALSDLAELHNLDLEGKAIGASLNVANIHAAATDKVIKNRNFREYVRQELGVKDPSKYFQAGVITFDFRNFGSLNLTQMSLDKTRQIEEPIFYDQCIFNSIFYQNVHFISVNWNHVWYMQSYSYIKPTISLDLFYDYARSRVNPKIVHYASKDKPTNKAGWRLAEHFWHHAINSGYYEDILADCSEEVLAERTTANGSNASSHLSRIPKMLVHLHVFYLDQVDYMIDKLKNVSGVNTDIFLTGSGDLKQLRAKLEDLKFKVIVEEVPNVGYDVYAFLSVLSKIDLSSYDYILKLHTKNRRNKETDYVYGIHVPEYSWRDRLVDAMLGSKEIFLKNLSSLESDKSLGCIGAETFLFSVSENNELENYGLRSWMIRANLHKGHHYIGGSMFFGRAFPFERLKSLNLEQKDFDTGMIKTKDSKNLAHVIERLFGLVIENEGFTIRGV